MSADRLQGFWEGKNAMTAARRKARALKTNDDRASAECVLASAHYSRAGTLWARGRMWAPLVAWHFWRARWHAQKVLDVTFGLNLSPEQYDVLGTIMLRGPFPNASCALSFFLDGLVRVEENHSDLKPHTVALLYIGVAQCLEVLSKDVSGDKLSLHNLRQRYEHLIRDGFEKAAARIPRIEVEEPDLHGQRQLVRVLKHCGAYFKRIGDARGEEFLARAKKLAAEVSSDQLAKIEAGI